VASAGVVDTVVRVTQSHVPPWPDVPPEAGDVRLRQFRQADLPMVLDLATDTYVAMISTLPLGAGEEEALAWIRRQGQRWAQGAGFSFVAADAATDRALGQIGLWLDRWADGIGTIGYLVAPGARGRGVAARALIAVSAFGFALPRITRLELFIEPTNVPSVRSAERAGYIPEEVVGHPRRSGEADVEMVRFVRRSLGS
jgi:RimJ/RimL family protein N-acetyltransferase